jgi:hypothetical protein
MWRDSTLPLNHIKERQRTPVKALQSGRTSLSRRQVQFRHEEKKISKDQQSVSRLPQAGRLGLPDFKKQEDLASEKPETE